MAQPSKNNQVSKSLDRQSSAPTEDIVKTVAVCFALFVLVLIVYFQTLNHEFTVCDDEPYIYGNPHVYTGVTWDNVKWAITEHTAGNWHPLTWMSHMLDVEMYGLHPGSQRWKGPEAGGHHFTSVLLHAAAAVVLFLAMQRLTGSFWCSAFVAAMFALHPLRAESVAWGAERKDVLSGLFWMLTLLAYGGYALRPNIWRYLLVVVAFGLGLASKSMLVTLPCVLLLLDFWPLRRWQPEALLPTTPEKAPSRFAPQSLGWLLLEKVPLLGMSAAVSGYIWYVQRNMGAMTMSKPVPELERIANAAVAPVAYIWSTIWPFNLAIFYPHPSVLGGDAAYWLLWQGLACGLLLVLLTALVLWNLKTRPYLAVGWFWFLGALVPVIGLVQVGVQSRADRYTYLPTIGLSIMLTWGVAEWVARKRPDKMLIVGAAGMLIIFWTIISVHQVSTWKTSTTVFTHAKNVVSDNYFAWNHLGLAYQQDCEELRRTNQLAEADKKLEDAGICFETSVNIAPSYDASNANLGVYFARRNDFKEALKYFKRSVEVNPHMVGHRSNLGAMYLNLGDYDEAEKVLRKAIEINPQHAQCHLNLGETLGRKGDFRGMLGEWREVIRICPDDPTMMVRAARLLATSQDASLRNGKEAVELIERAMNIVRPTNGPVPELLDIAAMAYAETGDFTRAEEVATEAARLAKQRNAGDFARQIQTRIMKYQNGKPYREPLPVPKKPTPLKQEAPPKQKAKSSL